ncbi:MAG: hypothetical protein OEY51_05990 [Cyclobacteriaceae bacterium]|nr:hypothetical protein [Cyclobacteriaceae bacterium]
MLRYSNHYLAKLEDLISETDYILRYEKGNFKPGYCILNDRKIIIVNKYYPLDGKINCLLEIIKIIHINPKDLSEKNRKLYYEQTQTEVKV